MKMLHEQSAFKLANKKREKKNGKSLNRKNF